MAVFIGYVWTEDVSAKKREFYWNEPVSSLLLWTFVLLSLQGYLSFKSSPCPIMIEKATPPWLLPNEAQRSLFQADVIFDGYKGVEGLVSIFN